VANCKSIVDVILKFVSNPGAVATVYPAASTSAEESVPIILLVVAFSKASKIIFFQ
jgi:hypothetical protein